MVTAQKKSTEFNFGIFDQLRKCCEDYDVLWLENETKKQSVEELASAIRGRVARDRKANASRIADLEARMSDTSRSDTVRRVAEMELAKLKALTFTPTDEEIAMLEDEVKLHEQVYNDARILHKKIGDLYSGARHEINKIIEWICNHPGCGGYQYEHFEHSLRDSENALHRLKGEEILR